MTKQTNKQTKNMQDEDRLYLSDNILVSNKYINTISNR